jgi:hypothetical protein
MEKGPKVLNTDVLVVGGGPAGIAAAVASAREGSRTILVERYGFLGGMATAGLVNPFMVSKFPSGGLIMPPIFSDVIARLEEKNAAKRGELFRQPHIVFDPEVLKSVLFDLILSAGVTLYLHSYASGVILKDERFAGALFESKSGQFRVFSRIGIDATGDGDLAYLSGAQYELGRSSDGLMQPATLNFRVGGVDTEAMPNREDMDKAFRAAKDEGRIKIEREKLLWFETTRANELHFNATRVIRVNGTKVEDLTRAEIDGRRQAEEIMSYLKAEVKGFENAFIAATATQVGIRETRRIIGHYMLTKEDVIEGKDFDDSIAKCSYPIDIHDPKGKGTLFQPLSRPYGIPYRCLIPKKIDNLIVAGRPISVSHEAFSSTRVMPTCMATGEAAGISASLCIKRKTSPAKADVDEICGILLKSGANYL